MGEMNACSPVTGIQLGKVVRTTSQVCVVDRNNVVDPTAGAVTVLMPTVYDDDSVVLVENSSTSVNAITIDGNGQLIDGVATAQIVSARGVLAFGRDALSNMWRRLAVPRLLDGSAPGVRLYSATDLAATLAGLSGGGTVYGTYAARPAAGTAGRIFIPSDGPVQFVDDGAEWRPLINQGVRGKEPPAASTWTKVLASGIGTTSLADQTGGVALTYTNNSNAVVEALRFAYRTAPALGASGYRVTAHLRPLIARESVTSAVTWLGGIGWRNATSGSVELMEWGSHCDGAGAGVNQQHWYLLRRRYTASNNGVTPIFGFSSQVISLGTQPAPEMWMRLERNTAGDRKLYTSPDNQNWREAVDFSSTANAFFTPDQVLFEACTFSDATGNPRLQGAVLDSWETESF